MKIKIISDSTCDLSPELVKKYDIICGFFMKKSYICGVEGV